MSEQTASGVGLRAFLDGLPNGGVAAFASELGITRIYLSQLAARQNDREPSAELCVRIEQRSGGQVRRWNLRPLDWHLIWPELVGAKGAPAEPRAVEAVAPVRLTHEETRDAA